MTIVLILIVAAIVLGPAKMVETSRKMGALYAKLQATKEELKRQLDQEISSEKL